MALFLNRGARPAQQRATNLAALIDDATGGRRGTAATRAVGWGGALSIPAVWAACRLRANVVSSLPVHVYRDRGGIPERVTGAGVPDVLSQPSATFDIMSWLAASQLSLDLRGNAYGRIVDRSDRTGLPSQIELVHPDDVTLRVNRSTGELEWRFAGRPVPADEVWHEAQNEVPGSVLGMSPITAAAASLGIGLAAQDYGAGFYDEALTPSALLSAEGTIDEQTAAVVKRRVMATQNGREPLVLGGTWTYRPLSVSPTDAMYLEVLRHTDTDAARLFDVPGELIEANTSGSSITYANREQRTQDLLALRLGPAIRRRERALSRLTVRGQYVKLDVSELLRGDLTTRVAAYDRGVRIGLYGMDEIRAAEQRPPLTDEQLFDLHAAGLLGSPTPTIVAPDGAPAAPAPSPTGEPAP